MENRSAAVAIIVAGGQGRRMGSRRPKQFLLLGSRPILTHTLLTFQNCEKIRRIYLIVPREHSESCREQVLRSLGKGTEIRLVPGGGERQDSVFNGLQAIASSPDRNSEWVVIHDGVRPLVTVEQINACLARVRQTGAAILAAPVADTLKRVTSQGRITETISRQDIWCAQTPQVFRFNWIREAHQRAREENFRVTDDAQLMEWMGRPVAVVPGNGRNIKITTPEDLYLAQAMLQHRRGGG